jgi:hypothetical protein
MTVSIEIKGNLAKLLATEDLIIEHKPVETASFDVDRRVLTLPVWDRASETVYDMLVAHEVGHALFTPNRDWWKEDEFKTIPHDYVNVVEDARIERLIKQRYRGLNRDFNRGYSELHNDDLFELEDTNVNHLKPIDRINLYFKIGSFIDIEFNDTENEFVTRISRCQTFDEVLQISKEIHKYTKEMQEQMQKQANAEQKDSEAQDNAKVEVRPDMSESNDNTQAQKVEQETDTQGQGDQEKEEPVQGRSDKSFPDEVEDTEQKQDEIENSGDTQGGEFGDINTARTQRSLDESLEDLTNTYKDQVPTQYVTIPNMQMDKVVVEFDRIKSYLDKHFVENNTTDSSNNFIIEHTRRFNEFKKSSNKEVNYLVKEFEMKKSADSYARQRTAKTGMLDTSKLHTYLYNEDVFKKVTTITDGKNHGLVFVLDWSGSMNNILEDTLKQLFQLVWFCKKTQIPYEVYAFTNDSWKLDYLEDTDTDNYSAYRTQSSNLLVDTWKEGDINIDGCFRMVNILSSKARTKDIEKQMLNLWLTNCSFKYHYNHCFQHPAYFHLSGTPLNEAIIATKQIVKQMMKKIQKVHVVILTDGEAHQPSYNVDRSKLHDSFGVDYKGTRSINSTCMLRNRRSGKTYGLTYSNCSLKLIECIKDDLPNVSFIAFRVVERGGMRYVWTQYGMDTYNTYEEMKEQVKKGNLSLKLNSFDRFFMIPQQHLSVDSDQLEQVDEGATKREVSMAFRKMFKNKKTNKFMLSEFAKTIA